MTPRSETANDITAFNAKRRKVALETLEGRTLLSSVADMTIHTNLDLIASATTGVAGYTPSQIKKAYGFDQVALSNGVKGDGTGQTIAIVDAYNDPNISADLATFDTQFSLSSPTSFKVVNQTGGSASSLKTDAGWAGEISLDVEWAHAIAPKANILLVEAKSDSLNDLVSAVDYARKASGVSVVSMSWGGSEFWGETSYDKYFTTPAGHQGVTFVAASGDEGSWEGAEWPAVSPGVLSVGGTSLSLKDSSGTYGSETGWSASTGGFSELEPEPSYQLALQNTGARTSPDVSYDANPNTGFAVYDSISYEGYKGWQEYGGTSAGAPQWAALVAIANQGRAQQSKATLDGLTGTLPTIYKLGATSAAYTADFHDITSGRSSFFESAFKGYDLVSGIGTPRAGAMVSALVSAGTASANAQKIAGSGSSSTTTHASWMRFNPPGQQSPVTQGPSQPTQTPPTSGSNNPTGTQTPVTVAVSQLVLPVTDNLAHLHADVSSVAAKVVDATVTHVAATAVAVLPTTVVGSAVRSMPPVFGDVVITSNVATAADASGDVVDASASGNVAAQLARAVSAIPQADSVEHAFHFIPLANPMNLIADAAASFADECALLPGALAQSRYLKAWGVTMAVVAVDVAAAVYWMTFSRKRSRQTPWSMDMAGGDAE